jgi:hypothetical protein
MINDFIWKYINVNTDSVLELQDRYTNALPTNEHFFQPLNLGIDKFLGLEVQRFVLIQLAPGAVGRIHTDWRPNNYGNQLALQIPLHNCDMSVTSFWSSDYTPPTMYTDNGQPYNSYDATRCSKISEFQLTSPLIFRTDIPHSASNNSTMIRRAISIRFKQDPWHLIHD